ncbi:MAG: MlaD family protein [Bdellovibrio sp.]
MKNLKSHWYLWFFPALAVGISIWLLWGFLQQVGPRIEIYFDDGTTLKPGKTQIRFRGVQIGTVDEVSISQDQKHVIAVARLQRNAKEFAVEGSKFWVETPKVSIEGITGLSTLIEGSYIGAQPGPSSGKAQKKFTGKIGSESTNPLEDTAAFHLEAPNIESITDGDSVSYRGFSVGSVTKVSLSKNGQKGLVQINLPYRYLKLIRTNTIFWRKSGIQAKLGLFKSEVKINSLDSILHGGIEFATPEPAGDKAKTSTKFPLFETAPPDWNKWNPEL